MTLMPLPSGSRAPPPWKFRLLTTQAVNAEGRQLTSNKTFDISCIVRVPLRSFELVKPSSPIDRLRSLFSFLVIVRRLQVRGQGDSSPPSTPYQNVVDLSRKILEGNAHAVAPKRRGHFAKKDQECGKEFFEKNQLSTRRTSDFKKHIRHTCMPFIYSQPHICNS